MVYPSNTKTVGVTQVGRRIKSHTQITFPLVSFDEYIFKSRILQYSYASKSGEPLSKTESMKRPFVRSPADSFAPQASIFISQSQTQSDIFLLNEL